jgi:ankyrin repeat protein
MIASAQSQFYVASGDGDLEKLQTLHRSCGVNPHENRDYAFYRACEHGHLNVVEWLHSLGRVEIDAFDNEAFVAACRNNHITVVKFLADHGVNIHAGLGGVDDRPFIEACSKGSLGVAMFLHAHALEIKSPIDPTPALITLCQTPPVPTKPFSSSTSTIVKWLIHIGADIKSHDDLPLSWALTHGDLNVAKTLMGHYTPMRLLEVYDSVPEVNLDCQHLRDVIVELISSE